MDLKSDLGKVSARTGLSPDQGIAAHLAGTYSVARYGFAPGYDNLFDLPDPIRLPRKDAAERGVPAPF